MRIALVVIALACVALIGAAVEAAVTGPAAPTNVEAVEVGTDYVKLAWGPSQPGAFTNLGEPKRNALMIGWGPSEDSRSAVTYTLSKDGSVVASGLSQPQYTLTGLNPKAKSFRTCVTAYNAANQASPQTCATWSKIA